MNERIFKYYPEDFKILSVDVKNMTLFFDIYDDHTKVDSKITCISRETINELELNADNLEIHEITSNKDISWEYQKDKKIIVIKFKEQVMKGDEVIINTKTTCKPTKNILEGMYYDETPEGCPPQIITQCQQWGFQRIVPCFDDMTAKCTYNTTIVADSRYTHMITNGDIVQEKTDIGNKRSKIVYDNTTTPMATYLSFIGVGTWDEYKRTFEYPNGSKFDVELLVLKGSEAAAANKAIDMIFTGVLWIHLYSGKDKYKNKDERKKIWDLFWKKEELLKENADIESIRSELKEISSKLNFGYLYTGTVYREIAMQNSNFGGMENVGNTTIVSNRIMPFKEMSDGVFAYLMEVKEHEFYHNINGSEVTGWSPFEFWLNEAITCYVEAEFLADIAGEGYEVLSNLHRIILPGGTFDEDIGAMGMPIIPDGFNNPDELVSGVTYSKSPKFINMLSILMGKEKFVEALEAYHKKYSHSNATNEDFRHSMEEVAGRSFERFFNVWLKQTGFPTVNVKSELKDNELKLNLIQSGFKEGMHYEFPFSFAVFNKKGEKLREEYLELKDVETDVIISNVDDVGFISFNRNFSFYGKVDYNCSNEELYLQAEKDDDLVGRYIAFLKIANDELTSLMKDSNHIISERFIDLYFSIISNEKLCDELGSSFLHIPESVEDKSLKHNYEELYQAKKSLRKQIADKYKTELLNIYENRKGRIAKDGSYVEKSFFDIKNRQVKNSALSLLSELDDKSIFEKVKAQFKNPICNSDKMIAFSLYLRSKNEDKFELIEEFEKSAQGNLVEWEQFLSMIGTNDSEDALSVIEKVRTSKYFRIEQSNDQRALLMRFAMNKRLSLCTKEGRDYVEKSILELANINEYNTNHILSVFSQISEMPESLQVELVEILKRVKLELNKDKVPSVYSTIERILSSVK